MVKPDAQVLFPQPRKLTVGTNEDTKEYTVAPFKMGKTLIILERLSRLLEEEAVSQIFTSNNFQSTFFSKLPVLLSSASPKLYELLALILIPNREIVQLNDSEKLNDRVNEIVADLKYLAETEDAFNILDAGIDAMGLEAIRGNVSRLSKKFQTTETKETKPQ